MACARAGAACCLLFVAPRVFRAPRVLSCGPGCCMHRWEAARPRAVRAASLRPAQLLVLLWPHGCSGRRRGRPPARLGVLTSFGAAPRSPPVPSGPSGALHTSGSGCADQWFGASARCSARPRRRPRAPQPGPASALAHIAAELPNFACNSPATISNVEFTALKSQRFQTLLNLHPIELHASFLRSGRIGACWRRRRSPLARCAVV